MQYSFLPFLLITSFFSINLPFSLCANDTVEYDNCSQPITCGSVNISFPFWGANRAEYCGKSGFEVTCQADVPVISMRNISFRILDMSNISTTTTPTLKVAREDYWGTLCPSTYYPTNLDFSLFAYSSGLLNVSFWYGCNTTVAATVNWHVCNSSVTATYLTQTRASNASVDPVTTGACQYKVMVPVFESASEALDNNATDIQTAIDGGFELDVLNADTGLCNNCLSSGGVCGQNNTRAKEFMCFCQTASSSTTICTENSSPNPSSAPSSVKLMVVKALITALKLVRFRLDRFSSSIGLSELNTLKIINLAEILHKSHFWDSVTRGTKEFSSMNTCLMDPWISLYITKDLLRQTATWNGRPLSEIAVGVARGLEYLHRGCNSRIFHFDIKPQKILLDKDFCPKISDFGLAKLCKTKESIVSMLGTRGTAGYIAPEVFSRNFGGVSHKSEVYSYDMLVLEMVGARRNLHSEVSHTSEMFPHYVYKDLELSNDESIFRAIPDEENELVRKMILISLGCIQTMPSNRPSMSKVAEMQEGPLHSLTVPPKPFLIRPKGLVTIEQSRRDAEESMITSQESETC